jgi:hypothetical protein
LDIQISGYGKLLPPMIVPESALVAADEFQEGRPQSLQSALLRTLGAEF